MKPSEIRRIDIIWDRVSRTGKPVTIEQVHDTRFFVKALPLDDQYLPTLAKYQALPDPLTPDLLQMIFSTSNIGIMFTMFSVHSKVQEAKESYFDPSQIEAKIA